MMTSELPDVSVSSSINTSTTTSGEGVAATGQQATAMIGRVSVLLALNVFNLVGNGFTLATIRLTPRLWTKTNFVLASMLVANVFTAVMILWYSSLMLVVYVFGNPCRYSVEVTALTPFIKVTVYASCYHLIVISVERYIAVVYPLHYESKFSDRRMKMAISAAWAAGIVVAMTFGFWLIDDDRRRCVLIPAQVCCGVGYLQSCRCVTIPDQVCHGVPAAAQVFSYLPTTN